ncbi:MAG: ATP synthase F0 subunit B [Candidatus Aminicenantes bacterium]|nr:MAG: ATP synthase F0 subunit B [Candidatus Aminicenantes bacterium]
MQKKKSIILVLFFVPFLLFMSFAEESHSSQTKDFLGKLINFLLLFGGLAYVLRKPLGKILQGRADSLELVLKEAKQSHGEAVVRLDQVESRMEKLDEEIRAMQREAETAGKSLHQNVIEEAKQAADRMKHFTNQEIEMLSQDAIREIKEYTATLAADLAQRVIKDRLTEEFHLSLIDRSIERLEKLHEKSSSNTKVRSRTH